MTNTYAKFSDYYPDCANTDAEFELSSTDGNLTRERVILLANDIIPVDRYIETVSVANGQKWAEEYEGRPPVRSKLLPAAIYPGQKLRHYKGSEYTVICVTREDISSEKVALLFSAVHTETEEVIDICSDGTNEWAYLKGKQLQQSFVVYDKPTDKHPWARPIEMFDDVIDGKSRFEVVED